MKFSTTLIIFSLLLVLISCKIKLVIKSAATEKSMLRIKSQIEKSQTTTYVTLMEGSRETYAQCYPLCREMGKPNYYTEVTNFPGYGYIYRCQCGDRYTSWYNMEDHTELCMEIMLGDTLFNDYLNLVGYDTSNCQCDALKEMLGRMINTN